MKIVVSSGKRKTAVARATIREGKGQIRINRTLLTHLRPLIAQQIIQEPLLLAPRDVTEKVDISVNVRGGGIIGQAEAARVAIARGLVDYTKSPSLRSLFVDYDRSLIAGDSRRREPKKFGGPSARTRKQKSYR